MDNRPLGRKKNVTGSGKGVNLRGEGLGGGPVGSSGRPSMGSGSGRGNSGGKRSGGGGKSPLSILVIIIIMVLGGGKFMLGGSDTTGTGSQSQTQTTTTYVNNNTQNGWVADYKSGVLKDTVAEEARAKRTSIKGNGKDQITIMVYMCGTDLESKYGMATSDLQEMANASLSDKVNIIVYTGGCSKWKNNVVSSKVNQIYQVKKGGLSLLVKDAGNNALTDPKTLTSFITYCKKNFPANRNELILWDHGGGSISGYGYDEKKASSGSMGLSGISQALKNAGMTFDFIGFDACLMATVENALMLDNYADYLIASEETEPGIGWYYTNWLSQLSENPSMPTIEIGKNIIDDYVAMCDKKCKGQGTTLSIVDLAELSQTVPDKLSSFAASTSNMIKDNQYQKVSDARYKTREYAQSSKIDQIDLIHFAMNVNSQEGKALADAIDSSVKYNKASSNMMNSYGLSIYFPYRKSSKVDSAVKTYQAIGMDEEYSRCIQSFAKMEVSGQAVSSGTTSPYETISGSGTGSSSLDSEAMMDILNLLMGGNVNGLVQNLSGVDPSSVGFLTGKTISDEAVTEYVTSNQLKAESIVWTESKGKKVLKLTEDEWSMVHDLALNMFYDTGKGYIDLGLDNVFDFDKDGNLLGETDQTWLAINDQPVAYYYESSVQDGDTYTITGYVPALLNGERVNLILEFTDENPDGQIVGANTDYENQETETVAKNLVEVKAGDTLDFLCSFYNYDGEFEDNYKLGDQMVLTDETKISNVSIEDGEVICTYRLTDIYNQTYWTPDFN